MYKFKDQIIICKNLIFICNNIVEEWKTYGYNLNLNKKIIIKVICDIQR